ncbi:MAG TPA: CHAT domain-containing protein [Leptolyngbyaceae cyanobacterium M33_DOE_097]|uniref:CHAT domain-containing protein n=1 Tax=Oscillatoriales cyanobacterium SpSt-418 TaxID=2282169 RepID=A0A7C3KG82_9CYAN|nr:CHAT domain-containing protein [Leptolyngbyaceae cyanobacterium M33_DOE_097]
MAFKRLSWLAAATLLISVPLSSLRSPSVATLQPTVAQTSQTRLAQAPDLETAARQAAETNVQAERLLERGKYDEAIATFQAAIQLYQKLPPDVVGEGILNCREGIAKALLLKGESQQSLALLQPILAERQKRDDTSIQFFGLVALANYYAGNYAEAERFSRAIVNHWESLRSRSDNDDVTRITLADQLGYIYRLLQKSLVAQGKTDAALEVAELSRARALVELLSQRGQQVSKAPTLAELRQVAQRQNSTLVMYSIVGREMRVLNVEPRDETDIYIWVIQPSGQIAFRQVNLKAAGLNSIKELVLATREQGIGVRGRGLGVVATNGGDRGNSRRGLTDPTLQKLHSLLITPIADQLPQQPDALVTFIPESSLLLVPFAALQDTQGKYLIETHTLRNSPSIQVLDLTRQRSRQRSATSNQPFTGQNALIVGNPTMPSIPAQENIPAEQLQPLPAAEQEARAISSLLKAPVLLGDQATKRAIVQRLPQVRLIHLATHGLLDLDANLNEFGELTIQPTRTARDSGVFLGPGVIIGPGVTIGGVSSTVAAAREGVNRVEIPGTLAFAPSNGDNGFLSAKEILAMQLQAELVVLSACDTGRGRITGDGAVGLARAFIGAGAPSVIVSLWAVPDAPTASLMTEFYQNLGKTQNKAQALRQAMLTTSKQYPAPRDWAAFTLIGEAE